jgi:hypothetical protein
MLDWKAKRLETMPGHRWTAKKPTALSAHCWHGKELVALPGVRWPVKQLSDLPSYTLYCHLFDWNAKQLKTMPGARWPTKKLTVLSAIFWHGEKLAALPGVRWPVRQLSDQPSNTFYCHLLDWNAKQLEIIPGARWPTKKLTVLSAILWRCKQVNFVIKSAIVCLLTFLTVWYRLLGCRSILFISMSWPSWSDKPYINGPRVQSPIFELSMNILSVADLQLFWTLVGKLTVLERL